MQLISNSQIEVRISTKGAEIQSIKKNTKEYIWQADPAVWPRKAPILFPIVGRVLQNSYQVNGNKYTLGQHGFARDREFQLIDQSNYKTSYLLTSDEKSGDVYPFKFELKVEYELQGSTILINQSVKNTDSSTIYFGLGNHPGFNCPLNEHEKYEDYYLEFEFPETISTFKLQDGYLSDKKEQIMDGSNVLSLSYSLFKDDALIFDLKDLKSRSIALKNKHHEHGVRVEFSEFSWLGIWSKPGPFVCIEPWAGVTDRFDHNGDFTKKTAINVLSPGEVKTWRWSMEIL
jgi:galactose mutarotase-like enzyme